VFVLFSIFILLRNSAYSQRLAGYDYSAPKPIDEDRTPQIKEDRPWLDETKDNEVTTDPEDELVATKPKHTTTAPTKVPAMTAAPVAAPVNYMKGKITPVLHIPYDVLQSKIKELIQWTPLGTGSHWPSWDAYRSTSYDPNRWEGFEWYEQCFCSLSNFG